MILYKRNSQGKPISWSIRIKDMNSLEVEYGLVGKPQRKEAYTTHRLVADQMRSDIAAKRREGYKELKDLYDNAPVFIPEQQSLLIYLNSYLPKFNTHTDGKFIPMLCKTLEDNKPFDKGEYFGQWKINGERCIITANKDEGLFQDIHLSYRSREGVDWTEKLRYLDDYLIPCIPQKLIDMMLEEGVALDGELYLPGYGINEINSFIKNTELPQHYKLQFWCYDLCIETMSAWNRQTVLHKHFQKYVANFTTKEEHLNNKNQFVLLDSEWVRDINAAITTRDSYIALGFEGLVIRKQDAEYQFGGRRNNSMLKYKRKEDGKFVIIDIIPEGVKRSHLPKFVCRNDINDATFECTINKPQSIQEKILIDKDLYIGKKLLVEYRERSGVQQVPFHAKGINILD